MRNKLLLLPLICFLLFSCGTTLRRTDLPINRPLAAGGVRFIFNRETEGTFRSRLQIEFRKAVPKRFFLTVAGGAYRVRVTLAKWDMDYTPIFFIVPPLLSYLGCPQGTASRRFSVAVFGGKENKLIALREGKVRKPFGLYYMIPSVKGRVSEAILSIIQKELVALFK